MSRKPRPDETHTSMDDLGLPGEASLAADEAAATVREVRRVLGKPPLAEPPAPMAPPPVPEDAPGPEPPLPWGPLRPDEIPS
jgi:hypothetical protein